MLATEDLRGLFGVAAAGLENAALVLQSRFFDVLGELGPSARVSHSFGKVFHSDGIIGAMSGGVLDCFLELFEIAWPAVGLKKGSRWIGDVERFHAAGSQYGVGDHWDVLGALPQAGDLDDEGGDTIVEGIIELVFLDKEFQTLGCGTDDAGLRFRIAD